MTTDLKSVSSTLEVPVLSSDGKVAGSIVLPEEFVPNSIPEQIIKNSILGHLANNRAGTVSTLTRSEVRGGGRKPWRQKGTGRARQGSIRAPHWRGGGRVFGPSPRSFRTRQSNRERKLAFYASVGLKAAAGKLHVADSLDLRDAKTKTRVNWLRDLGMVGRTLLIGVAPSSEVQRSIRNIPDACVARADTVNAYDVFSMDNLIVTAEALEVMRRVG